MKNIIYLLFFSLISFQSIYAQKIIEGTIIDGEFGGALPFASVVLYVQEGDNEIKIGGVSSDFDGKFVFEDLNDGIYLLETSFVGYQTKKISEINIAESDSFTIEITLAPAAENLGEVIVTTTLSKNSEVAVLNIQKNAVVLMDAISIESIKKAGDGDVASAVRRVPGVSVQEGKFVYVRGLGDRYSKTILGGMELPGLDPDKNTLQLDIFPTNLLENVQVIKSGNASYDADFSGGIVDLNLKDFSIKPEYSISVGFGYNATMHFNANYIYDKGSATDIFGFDDGYRALPINRNVSLPLPDTSNPESNSLQYYTPEFDSDLNVAEKQSLPNYNIALSASNSYDVGQDNRIGFISALNYRSEVSFFENYIESRYAFSTTEFTEERLNQGRLGNDQKYVNGLLGVTFITKNAKYKLTGLYVQNGESTSVKGSYAEYIENPYDGEGQTKSYVQRQVISYPFSAKWVLNEGKINIGFKVAPTFVKSEDKDLKTSIFGINNGVYRFSRNLVGFPSRIWRSLDENALNSRLNFKLKHSLGKINAQSEFGVFYLNKKRTFESDYFEVAFEGDTAQLNGDPNNMFNNYWSINNPTGAYVYGAFQEENQYISENNKYGGFISEELNFSEKFKAFVGVRVEKYIINYTGTTIGNITFDNDEFINTTDFFPSANLIYSVNDNRKFRASFYRTTARPSFKELSSIVLYDPVLTTKFFGNPTLTPTYISNVDLRHERYSENGDFVAFSLFYKNFQDPIEVQNYNRDPNLFWADNNEEAQVYGVELEIRKKFLNTEKNTLSFNLNASLIESRLILSEDEKATREFRLPEGESLKNYRQLQGQSPYLINSSLNYISKNNNAEFNLFYNVQGKTLQLVGNDNVADIFSVPFNALNFVAKKRFGPNNQQVFTLQINNILDDYRESQYEFFSLTPALYSQRRIGTTFQLGYSLKF